MRFNRQLVKKLLACSAILLGCQAAIVQAGLISLDPYYSGEVKYERRTFITPPGFPPPPDPVVKSYRNDSPLDKMESSLFSSIGCLCELLFEVNGYIIYDLSSLAFTAHSAALELSLDAFGDVKDLYVNTIDMFTVSELTALPVGGLGGLPLSLGEVLALDVSSGTRLGALELTEGSGVFSLELNSAALNLINASGGMLAFGLSHASPTSESLTEISFRSGPRLLLDGGPMAMPVPGTQWLVLVVAVFLIGWNRQGNRGQT